MFSDSTDEEKALAAELLTILRCKHADGLHIAHVINGTAAALVAIVGEYMPPPRFLRRLAQRFEEDPHTSAAGDGKAMH